MNYVGPEEQPVDFRWYWRLLHQIQMTELEEEDLLEWELFDKLPRIELYE